MGSSFTIVPSFLRNQSRFFESIQRGEAIPARIRSLAVSAIVFLAAFGFVTGLSHSMWQALSSAVKMPILFVVTFFFCLPAFYFFSLVLGTQLRLGQVIAVMLIGIGVTAFLLLGLSPVTLFFVLTSTDYAFFQLLAVIFVATSGFIGMHFLRKGMLAIEPAGDQSTGQLRRVLLGMWFALYAFTGSQMTWRLSPFVGDPNKPFVLVQPSRDNFYVDVIHAIERAFGTSSPEFDLGIGNWILLIGLIFGLGFVAGRIRSNIPDSIPSLHPPDAAIARPDDV